MEELLVQIMKEELCELILIYLKIYLRTTIKRKAKSERERKIIEIMKNVKKVKVEKVIKLELKGEL